MMVYLGKFVILAGIILFIAWLAATGGFAGGGRRGYESIPPSKSHHGPRMRAGLFEAVTAARRRNA